MTTTRWGEVERLFDLAVDRQGHDRTVFLEAACGADTRLRREVESLLRADAAPVDVLDRAVAARPDESVRPAIEAGDLVGPYRIRRRIAEGGMGAVFLAERDDERFRRQVAVKLLKQAIFSPAALGRFHNECRLLGRLEHPHVARLYDAGTTATGLPFMVMEYVEGLPIDGYVAARFDRDRDVDAVLALFLRVCAAVAYAHRHLIVHRDLKPANVLVTADGVPKLLDFGIAKLLDAAEMAPTRTGVTPMTPRYASPEQRRGEEVTTATDVYSLGLLLCELLTGSLPDPDDTAVKASALTARAQLRRRVRGDLDTILQKALAAEPERRYPSVERFADDLERHLGGLPVLARPPSLGYRARRFVRRRRWPVATAAAFLLLIVGSGFALALFARDAAHQRDRARIEASTAREVSAFLVNLFRSLRPDQHHGREPTVREILDRGAERLRSDLDQAPEVRATLLHTIGEAYFSLSHFDTAAALLESAVELRLRSQGDDHPAVAAGRLRLAEVEQERSRLEHAEALARQSLAALEGRPGLDAQRAAALELLGEVLAQRGDFDDAGDHLRRALALRLELFEPSHADVGLSHLALGKLHFERRDWAAAEASYRTALAILGPALGEDDPRVVVTRHDLAVALQNQGDGDGALATYQEILAIQRKLFGEDHANIASTLNSLGTTYYDLGDLERSEDSFRAAIAMRRRLDGDDTVDVALMLNNLGRLVERRGRLDDAVELYREAVDILDLVADAESPSPGLPLVYLGRALTRSGRPAEGEGPLRRAVALLARSLGDEHHRVAMARVGLAECWLALGRRAEAEPLLRTGHASLRRTFGDDHRLTRQAFEILERLAPALPPRAGAGSEKDP